MKKLWGVFLFVLGLGFLSVAGLFLLGYLNPKEAGILIETDPVSLVYINGQEVGQTPLEYKTRPGEATVKLAPLSDNFASFETKITLVPGVLTIIRRELKETEEDSAGEIVSFEKIGGKKAEIAVVSIPNSAEVFLDGHSRGFAPIKSSTVAGRHEIKVFATNYQQRVFEIKTLVGYKVTAVVKLSPAVKETEKIPLIQEEQTLVEILSTPTGFLRVRDKPGLAGVEIAQVGPGEKYLFLGEDELTGWYKIEIDKDREGWVSSQYAKKVQGILSPTPSPAATPSQ